jgi:hypothetical protein
MDEFILIFRHEDGKTVASPEQIQTWMKQTMDWIGGIAAQNKLVGPPKRWDLDGRVVKKNDVVTNGPYSEIKESVGGLLLVRAESYDEAVEIAKGCPGLPLGLTVEVRPVARVSPVLNDLRGRPLAAE